MILDVAQTPRTVLASILPSIFIIALNLINHLLVRLCALVGFSAVFALSIAMFTNARLVEVFSATAVYVA